MKHERRVTIPVAPWDVPTTVQNPVCEAVDDAGPVAPRAPASLLIDRAFMGRLNASDLDYMAKAILQMCDENHELRERVRRLEKRLGL